MLSSADAAAFERCVASGGVALFPADTVYGLACDPGSSEAVKRLYRLKGRDPAKPVAVMFFALEPALAALLELGPHTRAALARLLPGPLTVLLPNPTGRFPLACGPQPSVIGLRVPLLQTALAALREPVLQSSANLAGAAEPRRLAAVSEPIRAGADLVLDGGELPGMPSTVVDLGDYEGEGEWSIIRAGAAGADWVAARLAREG